MLRNEFNDKIANGNPSYAAQPVSAAPPPSLFPNFDGILIDICIPNNMICIYALTQCNVFEPDLIFFLNGLLCFTLFFLLYNIGIRIQSQSWYMECTSTVRS